MTKPDYRSMLIRLTQLAVTAAQMRAEAYRVRGTAEYDDALKASLAAEREEYHLIANIEAVMVGLREIIERLPWHHTVLPRCICDEDHPCADCASDRIDSAEAMGPER